MAETIIMRAVTSDNKKHADKVREILDQHKTTGLNLISSPGAGKTTLLEKTIKDNPDLKFGVIEGDVYTARDADRIEKAGAPSIQLNTEGACHLTAEMIESVLGKFKLDELDFLVVENIGNLICPSAFSLGTHKTVTLLSTPEGADKILKYPLAFHTADKILITKTDIASAVGFNMEIVMDDLKAVNPKIAPLEMSVISGDGLDLWYKWLRSLRTENKGVKL